MNPLVILLVLAATFGAGAWTGYEWLDGRIAKQERAKVKATEAERERLFDAVQAIGKQAAADESIRAKERITWQQRLKEARNAGNLVSVVCPHDSVSDRAGVMAPSGGGGSCVLTGEFVGLWDAALSRRAAPADPAGVDDAPGRAGATAEDALSNLDENGERWAKCRALARNWQQYAIRAGWVKP